MIENLINTERVEYEWEEFVSSGLVARETKDRVQFDLGDLADKVETIYGKGSIDKYALEIHIEKKSLLRYRDVSRHTPPEYREEYKLLSWSHFRVAAGQEDPLTWLKQSIDNGWSVERLAMNIKKSNGEEVAPEIQVKMTECPLCHKWTLCGLPEQMCVSFKDCSCLMK